MWEATEQWNRTGQPSRVFAEFRYQTRKAKNRGWEREGRVAAKAEHIDGKENPRFVVTSLSEEQWAAQELYEALYCARRHGKPDQRAVQFVCRSSECGDDACQSIAPVLFCHGLCAGQRIAAARIESNGTGSGPSLHHSHKAAQDRCAGTDLGAQGLDLDGIQLSLAERLSAGLVEPALLTQRRGKADFS